MKPLIAALKDESVNVRRRAAEALRTFLDLQAVEPLIAALRDKDEEVQREAAETLRHLTGKDYSHK